jgi:glycosyltransferase involved in cell wall biosynthesis
MSEGQRVTVGIPVYNGEEFVEQAIRSVLAQTYQDFELIIRDNASTDGTEEICRSLARRDGRIRYVRNPANLGAAPNFNAIVSDAGGEYFKWLAHDDLIEPTFLERCVELLDRDPAAVAACPRVRIIDRDGNKLEDYVSPFRNDHRDPAARLRERLRWGQKCFEVYGLIRLQELRRTKLMAGYAHGDNVLLAHLVLLGRLADIPEHLFHLRMHECQAMHVFGITRRGTQIDSEGYARWFDSNNGTTAVTRSFNKMLAEYLWMIAATPLPAMERLRCYREVIHWTYVRWRILAGEWKRSIYESCGLASRVNRQRRSST